MWTKHKGHCTVLSSLISEVIHADIWNVFSSHNENIPFVKAEMCIHFSIDSSLILFLVKGA